MSDRRTDQLAALDAQLSRCTGCGAWSFGCRACTACGHDPVAAAVAELAAELSALTASVAA